MQLALLFKPVLLLIYVLLLSSPDSTQHRGIDLSNYLSYGSLLVMLFTTFWFFRYTRLGKRIADPELRPSQSAVMKTLWIGLWASCLGILFSMLLLMNALGRLFFVLMTTPQTGIPIASIPGGDPARILSAIDAASLASVFLMISAEFIVLGFTLWLLFRVVQPSVEITKNTNRGWDVGADAP